MADVSVKTAARSSELQAADLRTQLLAQKTHLIGELAGAIDNQFNNIMMAVTSYAELELKKAPPAGRRSLEQVLSNAARATHLIQKLLAFSRGHTSSLQALNLNEVIHGLKDLLQQLVGEGVEIEYNLQSGLGRISADAVELEELLLSLAIHARNAMGCTGKLSLITKSADLSRASNSLDKGSIGKYVTLSVSDAGPSAARSQNSASPDGKGHDLRMNLTLASINRIVKEAQGLVRISSEPDQGTTFTIYFPALESELSTEEKCFVETGTSSSKTVLVVEDDDAVRVPAVEFLKMEGFKVLQARTGTEAISIAQQKRLPLDLLITDILMPSMSGRELAKEFKGMFPGLKVLYMSGDASEASRAGQFQDDILQKPFRLDKLNEKIRALLGG